jgi:hypothetical protein
MPKDAPPAPLSQTSRSEPPAAKTDRAVAPPAPEASRKETPPVQTAPKVVNVPSSPPSEAKPPQALPVVNTAPKPPQVSPPSPVPPPAPTRVSPNIQETSPSPDAVKPPPPHVAPSLNPILKAEGDRLLNMIQKVSDTVLAQRDARIGDYDSKTLHRSKLERNCDPIRTHLLAFSTNPPPISPASEFFNKEQVALLSSVASSLEEPVSIGDLLIACSRHFARSNWIELAIIAARAGIQLSKTEKFNYGEAHEWAILQAAKYCITEGVTNFSRRERELKNLDRYAIRAAATIVNDVERRVRTETALTLSRDSIVQAAIRKIEGVNLGCSDYFSYSIAQLTDQKEAAPLFRLPTLDAIASEYREYNEANLEAKDRLLVVNIKDFESKKLPECQAKMFEVAEIAKKNTDISEINNASDLLPGSSWLSCSAYYWLTDNRLKSVIFAHFAAERAAAEVSRQLLTPDETPQSMPIYLDAIRYILTRTRIVCHNYQFYGYYQPSSRLPIHVQKALNGLGEMFNIRRHSKTIEGYGDNKSLSQFRLETKEVSALLRIASIQDTVAHQKVCPFYPWLAQSSP